jgi:hypothetical protein
MVELPAFSVGTQTFIEPDVLLVTYHQRNKLNIETFEAILTGAQKVMEERPGQIYWLVDSSMSLGMEPDVRRRLREEKFTLKPRAVIMAGAPFPVRVVGQLVNRGMILAGRWEGDLEFPKSVEDAWEWIRTDRLKKLEEKSSTDR